MEEAATILKASQEYVESLKKELAEAVDRLKSYESDHKTWEDIKSEEWKQAMVAAMEKTKSLIQDSEAVSSARLAEAEKFASDLLLRISASLQIHNQPDRLRKIEQTLISFLRSCFRKLRGLLHIVNKFHYSLFTL
jgi:hypothetical protein